MCQSVKDWKIASCIFTDWWSEELRTWLFTCDEKSAPELSLKLLITSDWLHKRRLMKSLLPLRPPSEGLEELFPRRRAASALRWHETRARDWVSWHGCGANAGNKSASLTRRLSSCDVPRCPHRLWANKDVWEGKPEWSQQMSRWKASSVWREAAGSEDSIRKSEHWDVFIRLSAPNLQWVFTKIRNWKCKIEKEEQCLFVFKVKIHLIAKLSIVLINKALHYWVFLFFF